MATTSAEEAGSSSDLWYLDTGCSNHMSGHREWFVNLNEDVKSKVKFPDNSTVIAEGMGKVMIKQKNGEQATISDVIYVPNTKNNLLSLG